jgi:hypothetical protein
MPCTSTSGEEQDQCTARESSKPAPTWSCHVCTYDNFDALAQQCQMCQTQRYAGLRSRFFFYSILVVQARFRVSDWAATLPVFKAGAYSTTTAVDFNAKRQCVTRRIIWCYHNRQVTTGSRPWSSIRRFVSCYFQVGAVFSGLHYIFDHFNGSVFRPTPYVYTSPQCAFDFNARRHGLSRNILLCDGFQRRLCHLVAIQVTILPLEILLHPHLIYRGSLPCAKTDIYKTGWHT